MRQKMGHQWMFVGRTGDPEPRVAGMAGVHGLRRAALERQKRSRCAGGGGTRTDTWEVGEPPQASLAQVRASPLPGIGGAKHLTVQEEPQCG